MKKIILTGDRPYRALNALTLCWLSERESETSEFRGKFDEIHIMIADAQALTDNADHPEKVRSKNSTIFIQSMVPDYLACGYEKSTIFIQSMVQLYEPATVPAKS